MTDKSHVSLEQKVCRVCGKVFDTGCVILDRRLRPLLDKYTITGFDWCPTCDGHRKNGYVALAEVDGSQSVVNADNRIERTEDAHRTGNIAFLRRTVCRDLLGANYNEEDFLYVGLGFIDYLETLQQKDS